MVKIVTIEQIEQAAKNLIDAQKAAQELGFAVGVIQAHLMDKETFDIIPCKAVNHLTTCEFNHYRKTYNGIDYVWLEAIENE